MIPKKKNKYEKIDEKKPELRKIVLTAAVIIICGSLGAFAIWRANTNADSKSVYQIIVQDGYQGTQEQWLASLVGQEVSPSEGKTAYELACENGYKRTERVWMKTLTGNAKAASGASPYAVACKNGYSGSLAQWLESIADAPENLGRSEDSSNKTEYELAREYGYTGTFLEWLISVVSDRAF